MTIKELDVVALKVDIPELDLKAGDTATIVNMDPDGMLILEFVARDGYTIGLLDIDSSLVREPTPAERKRRYPVGSNDPWMEAFVDGKLLRGLPAK
jgi:hypothetical protein